MIEKMVKKPYLLGQMIGPELLDREFKEFCLQKLNLFFSEEEIINLIYYCKPLDKIIWNKMINSQIYDYFIKYIPKYIGNFSKAGINGTLFFGIDDMGFIEGIPYYGRLSKKSAKNMIIAGIINSRGIQINDKVNTLSDQAIVNWYYDNLDIEIIELKAEYEDIDTNYSENINLLKNILQTDFDLKEKWKNYEDKYNIWHKSLYRYTSKLLVYLLDDTLNIEVIQYIIDDFNNNPSLDKSKLDSIIQFYKQDKTIFRNMGLLASDIKEYVKDKYHPIRWLLNYKDYYLEIVRKQKPMHPIIKPDSILYYKFCNKISTAKAFLMKSSDIRFYLIKVKILKMENSYLEYRYSPLSPWMSKVRILLENGPSCQ